MSLISSDPINKCDISVAMCTYNGEKYIQQQLESIRHQSHLPLELIICDDGSTDSTLDIIRRFSLNSPFPIKLHVNERNLGSTANFEKAIGLCNGGIIALSDQDDVWSSTKLECISNKFADCQEAVLVFTDATIVDQQLKPLGYTLWESINFDQREKAAISMGLSMKVLLKHNVVTGATLAFKSEYRKHILPIPKDWVHDAWLALILSSFAKIDFIDQPLILYRQHPRQQLGARKPNICEYIKDRLKNKSKIYMQEYQRFETAIQRLELLDQTSANKNAKNLDHQRLMHLKLRGTLPGKLMKRIRPVVHEVLNGQYHKYSNGWVSAIRDVVGW
ncbi:MAG: glycosyltransferase family 2 protein [Verrucomicrobiota bacterium]|nr:glycosyltransferase family 2 protein [Verrucomicrobiota bacterium]